MIDSNACFLNKCISLGALVPNSRDRHEKQWQPDFTHLKTHPKMRFVWEKQTEVHF